MPATALNLAISAPLRTRLDLLLFSEVEGRVPRGAYQRFFEARISEFLNSITLDLAPYANSLPGEHVVRGSLAAVTALKETLKKAKP